MRIVIASLLVYTAAAVAQISVVESERQRIELGQKLAAGKEMRLWRFEGFKEPMQDWPKEVNGAFLEVRCEDQKFSEAALILVRDDFRVRAYPAKALIPEDRVLAERLEAERAAKDRLPSTKPYVANLKPYTAADATILESEHFTYYVGKDANGSGKIALEDPEFMPRQKQWFEKVWTHLGRLGAPLPMAGDAEPRKINVYITGTGLPKHKDGFAFGGESVIMHPNALGAGSSVVIHEFTHSVQYYSKGFRDSPFVGWFWECHGNWSTHQFMPAYPPVLTHYAERAHYELNSSRHNYGSWPFLQTLAEHPRFGSEFPYAIWPACKRNERDGALEDPFQTIMRLGMERGVWKDGVGGFGDIIGELAARMVAWDFQNQFYHQKEMRNLVKHSRGVPSIRTVLQAVPDRPKAWRPLHSHAPRQYGVNLVDLVPNAPRVEVDFTGIIEDEEGSDWRVTLVAHNPLGHARYSPTVRTGKVAIDVQAGEQVTLAVAATPRTYSPLAFRPGYNQKRRYPYEVTVTGAEPAPRPPLREDKLPDGAPHPNGGGFVAKSAKVAPTAFVGPNARVLDQAEVGDEARIEDFAVIRQNAKVLEKAVVGGFARVSERAQVTGQARVRGFAHLTQQAKLTGHARLLDYATVDGRGVVSGDVIIRGFGEIHLQPATELTGGTVCGEDLEVHFMGSTLDRVEGGRLYGYLNSDFLKKEPQDNHWLYAHWDFNVPRKQVLRDVHADCEGVLRGAPTFTKDGERGVLTLNGRDQYAVVEGHVVDSAGLTLDVRMRWDGKSANQVAFDFAGADSSLLFTPQDARGKATLVLRQGKTVQTLSAPGALPAGRWVRVTLSVGEGRGTMFLDGTEAATGAISLRPGDLGTTAGFIGRAQQGGAPFHGALDDFKVYRRAVTDLAQLEAPARKP